MFLCYYVAWPCDLDLRPFDLESASHVRPTYQFLLSYDYRLLSYESTNIWSHFPYLKQSLRMRRVTWPLTGGKNSPHFEIPDPNLPIHLVTFTALRRRLSHAIGKNSVFPLWRLQSLLRMGSITWPVHRRSPKTTRNNFLTPNCLFTIQLLCGYDDD